MISPHRAWPFGRGLRARWQATSNRPAGIWSSRSAPGRLATRTAFLLLLALGCTGCGGATVPCPTPTTDLDRHRTEAERAQEAALTAAEDAHAAESKRSDARRRIEAARAALDSLAPRAPAPSTGGSTR